EVNKLEHAVDVSAGDVHTCAVTWSGEVWCWGNGNDYRLGNAKKSNKAVPVKAKNLSDVVAVAAGKSHTCAFDNSGEMYCWGKNGHGQIGNGTQNTASTPTNVKAPSSSSNVALSDIMAIGVGNRHSCAIKTSGKAFCWGDDAKGQLGTDQVSGFVKEPVEVQ
ncbi:MAG: RCC1 domain-containing protein, partial [Bradymonadaceae bacterium]